MAKQKQIFRESRFTGAFSGGQGRRYRYLIPSLTLFLHLTPGMKSEADWIESGHRFRPGSGFLENRSLKETMGSYREILTDHILEENPGLDRDEVTHLVTTILEEALYLNVPETMKIDGKPVNPVFLLASMIHVESSFDRYAVSVSDARGLMQIKPDTADWISYKMGLTDRSNQLFHTRANVRIGMEYMRWLLSEMHDLRKAVLAYNAGPGSVLRGKWDENYWEKTLKAYRSLEKRNQDTLPQIPTQLASLN